MEGTLQDTSVNADSNEPVLNSDESVDNKNADTSSVEAQQNTSDSGNAEQSGETNANDSSSADESPFLIARYNKTDVPLTKEKATELAQKAMHYEKTLNFLAAVNECSVNELLKKAVDNIDNSERARLEEQYPDDPKLVEVMLKNFKDENQSKYNLFLENLKTEEEKNEQDQIKKLGNEFIKLQKDFPELKEIKNIPDSVLKDFKNMSLEHAYLKYLRNEQIKIESANQKQIEAENQTAGSMSSIEGGNSLIDDMIRGVGNL